MGRIVGSEFIGHQLPRDLALPLECSAKEAFSSPAVPAFCDQNVVHIPILVDRPPQVESLSSDRDEEFINMPNITQSRGVQKLDRTVNN